MSESIRISTSVDHDDVGSLPTSRPAGSTTVALRLALTCLRGLTSDVVTLALLVVLASTLVAATLFEAQRGPELARWYFYDAYWFSILLATLAANLATNALRRFPWRRDDIGSLILRLGAVLLLVGVLRASLAGVEGRLVVSDEQLVDTFLVPHRSLLAVSWANQPHVPDYRFEFDGGPVAWTSSRPVELGEVDGLRARVLRYLPRARAVSTWKQDPAGGGGPFLRFTIVPPGGSTPPAHELADEGYGDELIVGPLVVRLEHAFSAKFIDDFLHPEPLDQRSQRWGTAGRLRVYHGRDSISIDVQQGLEKRHAIGDDGVEVQIARYLPHARPDAHGRFHPGGEDPKNPLVEIDIFLPGEEKPRRQIAFAKQPLLTLDGVTGSICPVKFRFDHPSVSPPTGVELLRADKDSLWARVIQDGDYRVERVRLPSGRIKLAAGFELHVLDYLPSARREVHFASADESAREAGDDSTVGPPDSAALPSHDTSSGLSPPTFDAAAEVEIEIADQRQRLWLLRNVPLEAAPVLSTPDGPLRVHFATAARPLGFQLGVNSARDAEVSVSHATSAGSNDPTLFVVATDAPRRPLALAPGNAARLGDFALHGMSVEDAGHGKRKCVLHVSHDPGRPWKYAGTLIACLGAVICAWRHRRGRTHAVHHTADGEMENSPPSLSLAVHHDDAVHENSTMDEATKPMHARPDHSREDDDWRRGRRAA